MVKIKDDFLSIQCRPHSYNLFFISTPTNFFGFHSLSFPSRCPRLRHGSELKKRKTMINVILIEVNLWCKFLLMVFSELKCFSFSVIYKILCFFFFSSFARFERRKSQTFSSCCLDFILYIFFHRSSCLFFSFGAKRVKFKL